MSNDSNENISVYLEHLRSAGFTFHQGSQQIAYQLTQLDSRTSQVIEEMACSLSYAPWALEALRSRWSKALGSLSDSLGEMGNALYSAADSYENTDEQVGPK
jgi:uncharacterized protein YukE